MKIIRILTACILLCCIMLSMTSCSNADNAVFPDGFEEYVPLLGMHTESVIPKLDPDNRLSLNDLSHFRVKVYVSPDPVMFHGIPFTETFRCYEEDTILGSIEYIAVLNNGSTAVAQTLWDFENHMVKYFGIPESSANNQKNSTPLYQKTVEEIEAWITEGKGDTSFSQQWVLGELITDESLAYLNYYMINQKTSIYRYMATALPTLSVSASVTTNGDGAVAITLYYHIEVKF